MNIKIKQTQALLCNKLLVAHIFFHITDLTSFQIGLKCKCKCVGNEPSSSVPRSIARNLNKQKNADETFAFLTFFISLCTILRLGGIQSFC